MVDALIDAIIVAASRPALVIACCALDWVIRAGRYWIPNQYKSSHWIAYWDVFRLLLNPGYFRGILTPGGYPARQQTRGGAVCRMV